MSPAAGIVIYNMNPCIHVSVNGKHMKPKSVQAKSFQF